MILHGEMTVEMNTEIGHCGEKWNVGRQQLELLDVDFGKLLSGSYPYHLRFVSIHLQSVAAHPGFDPLRAADEPLDSRLYVRGSSADMTCTCVSSA